MVTKRMLPAIRAARLADERTLDALVRHGDAVHARIQPGYFRGGAAGAGAGQLKQILSSPAEAILVACDEDAVVGFVHVKVFDAPDDPAVTPRRRAHVHNLVVRQARRRRGVGTALMSAAAAWAQSVDACDIVLTVWSGNQAAEGFYESLGYRPLSRVLHRQL